MKKLLTLFLALLLALAAPAASAENLGALLASSQNRSTGSEAGVYDALYALLNRANGGALPLSDWSQATTYLSKCATGEGLTPDETLFDQSVSAYEKLFLLTLDRTTLSEEDAGALTALFEGALANFPADGEGLYLAPSGQAFLPGTLCQALQRLGLRCEAESVNGAVTLNAVYDAAGGAVISARDALTTLPGAMLLKRVPEDKRRESAGVLAFLSTVTPGGIDWARIAGGDDAFFAEFVGERAGAQDLDPAAQAQLTDKWLDLLFACDALDAQARGGSDGSAFSRVRDALLAFRPYGIEVLEEPGQALSLRFPGATLATPEPTATATAGATDAATTASPTPTAAPTATATPSPSAIAVDPAYSRDYVIYVSKGSYTIAILGKDASGQFTRTLRTFSTGIGRAGQTRAGTYTIEKKERWHSWSGGTYSPYSNRHSGGAFIHGPIYTAKDSNRMQPGSYNEIGTNCSSGCLRTTSAAAAWVYYNCSVGTLVIVANDSRFSARRPAKIPSSQRYDPTDPGASPEIPITDFTLSPAELALKPGESASLSVTAVVPTNNSTGNKFKYASGNPAVATVSATGTVTAVAVGTARITVTADDLNACARSVTVTVADATPTPTPTPTPAPETTVSPAPEGTGTPAPETTVTPAPEVTETPVPEVTETPAPEGTETPAPEGTETPAPEATVTPAPVITPTPAAGPSPTPRVVVIDAESRPEDIRHVQEWLVDVGLLRPEQVSGALDDDTRNAVAEFQRRVNEKLGQPALETDGLLDALTLEYLEKYAREAREALEPTETPAPTETPEAPETPDPSETPEVPETPAPSDSPEVPEIPEPSDSPEAPETPAPSEVAETPEAAESPEATGTPEPPEATPAPTPTSIPEQTPAPTPTSAPEQTPAPTPMSTPAPTPTPTPKPTPRPEAPSPENPPEEDAAGE